MAVEGAAIGDVESRAAARPAPRRARRADRRRRGRFGTTRVDAIAVHVSDGIDAACGHVDGEFAPIAGAGNQARLEGEGGDGDDGVPHMVL